MRCILKSIFIYMLCYCICSANENSKNQKLPIPRFVSIKSSEANIRTGPNLKYPIKWVFKKYGEPVEVIAEFEHWRKIKDITNEEGWVHESMIKNTRTGIIIGTENKYSYAKNDINSKPIMEIEPNVRVKVLNCKDIWCQIKIEDKKSWIKRTDLWGIYDDEYFTSK